MITEHYLDKWQDMQHQNQQNWNVLQYQVQMPSQGEIDEFRRLLEKAREYDKRTGQPECELDEKKAQVRALAKELGVEVAFL